MRLYKKKKFGIFQYLFPTILKEGKLTMKVKEDKKIFRKSLSVIMTVIMLLSMMPTTVLVSSAADQQSYEFFVTDDAATAIEGAVISLAVDGADFAEESTDGEGKCIVNIDSDVEYTYTIIKKGYVTATGTLDVAKTDAYVLDRKTVVSVTGTVKNSDDTAVKNASVTITDKDGIDVTVVSDENGAFTIENVYKEDSYTVKVQADGYKAFTGNLNTETENTVVLSKKETVALKFAESEKTIAFGTQYSNVASCVSGTADKYVSSDSSVATVDNTGKITCHSVGQVVITATKNATENTEEATCQYTLTITEGEQAPLTWSAVAPETIPWNVKFVNTAEGGTGTGKVVYSIEKGSDIADVNEFGELVASSTGEVVVVATKDGGENYKDAVAKYTITFVRADQAPLAFAVPAPADIYYGDSFKNIATGGSLQNAVVVYSVNDLSVAKVNKDGSLETLSTGTVTVTAKIAQTDLYNEVSAQYVINILKADQKTEFKFEKTADNQTVTYGETYTNVAVGGDGDGAVVYSSSDNSIATVDKNGVVTPLKAGKVTITATKEADKNYNEVTAEYSLTVNKASQTIVFDIADIPGDLVYGVDFINKATGKTEIAYSSSAPDRIDIDENGKLIVRKAGSDVVVITATAKETEQYLAATAEYSVMVAKAEHVISDKKSDVITFNDNNNKYKIEVDSLSVPGVEKKFMVSTDPNSIVSNFDSTNGTFDICGAGDVSFSFVLKETDLYEMTMGAFALKVEPDEQEIVFEKSKHEVFSGEDFEGFVAEAADEKFSGEGKVTYSVKNDNGIIKTINPETGALELTYLPGSATIVATKAACKNYKEAIAEYTLIVKEWIPDDDYFEIVGRKNSEYNEWFIGSVSIAADADYMLSFDRENGKTEWTDELKDVVTENTESETISFFIKDCTTGYISGRTTVTVKKDSVVPVGKITVKSESLWEKLLSFFRLSENENVAIIDVESEDALSGVAAVEYFVDYSNLDVMTKEELDAIDDWEAYSADAVVDNNSTAVVYAKITDNAGNYIYVTTNGIILDSAAPTLDVAMPSDNLVNGYFVENVVIPVSVADQNPSSGIKEISYEVFCDGNLTQQGTLFTFEIDDPAESDLVLTWDSETEDAYINVDANANNSDYVKLVVKVCDNSGNETEDIKEFKIAKQTPVLTVDIENFDNPVAVINSQKYFTSAVKATITVKGRTSLFYAEGLSVSIAGGDYIWEQKWTQKNGATVDDTEYSTEIIFTDDAEYSFRVNYKNKLGVAADEFESEVFGIDLKAPTGAVTIDDNTWKQLIEKLTFGLYNNSSVEYVINAADSVSDIKSVEYYVTDGKTALTESDLNAVDEWLLYESAIEVAEDEVFTVYAKIIDNVDKCVYISSNGYIVDKTAPSVNVEPEIEKDIYTDDVKVNIAVSETAPYSGIDKVTYKIICDGVETTAETVLVDNEAVDPEYSELKSSFADFVVIDADKNNGNEVKVVVKAIDNAGNVTTKEFVCDIDTVAPAIKVDFDNNNANNGKYFSEKRTATIEITERTEHFDKENVVITITATDVNGQLLENVNVVPGDWTTVEGDSVNEDTHTTTMVFAGDANYTFTVSYVDEAGFANTEIDTGDNVAPFEFTVDKSNPTSSVAVNETIWTQINEKLGFEIFSNQKAEFTAEYSDNISDIDYVEYYKDSSTQSLSLSELMAVADWTAYEGPFNFEPDETAFVYLKVVNNAGLVTYVNTNGVIIEATDASIVITPEVESSLNDIYTTDVPLTISVADTAENASGIKSIEYWVECDGIVTQDGTLYTFTEALPVDYDKLVFSKTITSDDGVTVFADKNKGNKVEVFVKVTDNAGNIVVESMMLDIDNTAPVINLNYDNNASYKDNFFDDTRIATIEIIERAGHFNADNVNLVITAKDYYENDLGAEMYEIGTWVTTDVTAAEIAAGKTVDDAVHTLQITFHGDAKYTLAISYADNGGLVNKDINTFSSNSPFEFTVDKSLPDATITIKDSAWSQFLNKITFGLYDNIEVTASIDVKDTVSGIESVEYYIEKISVNGLSIDEIRQLPASKWTAYEDVIRISPDEHFIVYARVVNNTGLVNYFSSDGYITEDNNPEVELSVLSVPAENDIYTDDVEIKISASEAQLYSGLKEVVYWVETDGVRTTTPEEETLFFFDERNPEYNKLVENKEFIITVPADKNKGNVIKVTAKVTDNAGNSQENSILLDIDNTDPAIDVSFAENAYKVVGDKGYFSTTRRAVITVTERTSHFDPSLVDINIVAKNAEGNVIAGVEPVIGSWDTVEITSSDISNGKTVDDAQHILTIDFVDDANYTFAISMTDKAGRANNGVETGDSVTPYNFCVDRSSALAVVCVDGNAWSEFLSKITFGLYKNQNVEVSASANDTVSGIESIEYFAVYKEFGNIDSVEKLERLSAGKLNKYTAAISIIDDTRFVYYFKVVNNSGVVKWINSNGFIMEKTGAEIGFEVLTAATKNGNYNSNVDVKVSVSDIVENMKQNVNNENLIHLPYSGLKSVTYETICATANGEIVTDSGVLFAFNDSGINTVEDFVDNICEEIRIYADKNKGHYVKLVIRAEDNAGNVTDKELKLIVDNTAPVISITYDDVAAPYSTVENRGYFSVDTRTATIEITERTAHFDADKATAGIVIEAVDVAGKEVAAEYKISEWVTEEATFEGSTVDDAVHTATIEYPAGANYIFSVSYTDEASNEATEIKTNDSYAPYEFTVDNTTPVATVSFRSSIWKEMFDFITFNIFSKEDSDVVLDVYDATSPVEIKYIKTDSIKSYSSLDNVNESNWSDINDGVLAVEYNEATNRYKGNITVAEDERLTVYFRVTDAAGNRIFIRSDGIIVDETISTIEFEYTEKDIYNGDIPVKLVVNDDVSKIAQGVYSGLKEVKYWIEADGVETQRETFTFEISDKNNYEDLTHYFEHNITVDSKKNNSSDVKLWVVVTDNAGNVSQKNIAFDIDITAPGISVSYDNNTAYKVVDSHGYFAAGRTATITITERTVHFDADKALQGIKITAKDSEGNTVIDDISTIIGSFTTIEGKNADEAKHIVVIDYAADANYEFSISYTDDAGNANKKVETGNNAAPYSFSVDTVVADASISVGKLGFWDTLLSKITFGRWTKSTVNVSGTATDKTSGIESVSYYKTSDTTALTIAELQKITAWTEFTGFDVAANERFVVYLKIVDNSGNVAFISTDGIIVDDVAPVVEDVSPEITITPVQPVNDIYNTDVGFAVKVVDPKSGSTEAFSGLKKITYQVINLGNVTQEGTLYDFDLEAPVYPQLLQSWEDGRAVVVDKKLNNSNDVEVKIFAEDNSGNKSEASVKIKIDITAPEISVSYDNNNGDTTFSDNAAFKSNRVATIVVTERNFDAELVNIALSNVFGDVPVLSGWSTVNAGENGDATTHTAYLVFNEDGDYTFDINCSDMAGNKNTEVDYGNSMSPNIFTVDKTAPVFSIVYDNNSAQNNNYYKAHRTATIKLVEHNFETSRVVLRLTATDNGRAVKLPAVSEWVNNGDEHILTINYFADANYTFDFEYVDKAGNSISDIAEQSFVVDTTLPVLTISNIVDETANNDEGNIGFIITATDTNFGTFEPVVYAAHQDDMSLQRVDLGSKVNVSNGQSYVVSNISEDGIYKINCTVIDKAGNSYNSVTLQNSEGSSYIAKRSGNDTLVSFSVNRNGSVFMLGNEYTESVVEKYYVQNITEDIAVIEINADVLEDQKVTLNGKELVYGTDYTVSVTGGGTSWMKYVYTIDKALFENEGEYNIVVSSVDKATNNAFSDVKNAEIKFVVDRTAPVLSISGLESKGRYQTEIQTVTIIPTDDGGALNTLKVVLVDENGEVISELINLHGEELENALLENDGRITFEINEGLYQNVRIICTDCSVNEAGENGIYDEVFNEVSVSPQAILIFWAYKPLRYGTIGGVIGVAALVIILIARKKNKSDK